MNATQPERSRASRLRARLRKGSALTAEELSWFESYESRLSPRARRAAPVPQVPPPSFAPRPESHATIPPHSAPSATPSNAWVDIDFGVPQPDEPAVSPCDIPDCPECRKVKGPATCGTTGKKVWPPMSEAGAEAMASAILGLVSLVARFVRKDKAFVAPTALERKQLAKALREVALRRASVVGAADDLFALIFVAGSYTRRAFTAPGQRLPENVSGPSTQDYSSGGGMADAAPAE